VFWKPGINVVAGKLAAFAVTPEVLIEMMKHGMDACRIVENGLPPDAKFVSVHIDHDMIWIIVQSDSFEYIGPTDMIPELPRTVFTKVVH
jgi:hypothetical protein